MSIAAYNILETKRPYSGGTIGWRIKVAAYNNARWHIFYECYVQSYAPKWLITESGDYPEPPSQEQVNAFLEGVKQFHRITRFVKR